MRFPSATRQAGDHFRDLARGDPDHLGRRLYTDAGKSNAKYVARVAWRAYHAKEVPGTARQWGLLEASIRRTFEELEDWGLTATRVARPPSVSRPSISGQRANPTSSP